MGVGVLPKATTSKDNQDLNQLHNQQKLTQILQAVIHTLSADS